MRSTSTAGSFAALSLALVAPSAPQEQVSQLSERPGSALVEQISAESEKASFLIEQSLSYLSGLALTQKGAPITWTSYTNALCKEANPYKSQVLEYLLGTPADWLVRKEVAAAILAFHKEDSHILSPETALQAEHVVKAMPAGKLSFDVGAHLSAFATFYNPSTDVNVGGQLTSTVKIFTQDGQLKRVAVGQTKSFFVDPAQTTEIDFGPLLGRWSAVPNERAEVTFTGWVEFASQNDFRPTEREQIEETFIVTLDQSDPNQSLYLGKDLGGVEIEALGARLFMARLAQAQQALVERERDLAADHTPVNREEHVLLDHAFPNLIGYSSAAEMLNIDAAYFEGHAYTLVEFGFPGCGHCIAGIPALNRVTGMPDLNVIYLIGQIGVEGVAETRTAFDQRVERSRRFDSNFPLPEFERYVLEAGAEKLLQTNVAPLFMLVDRTGNVREVFEGGHMSPEVLAPYLSRH